MTAASSTQVRAYAAAALLAVAAIVTVEIALVAPGYMLEAQLVDALLVFALLNAGSRREAVQPANLGPLVGALRALAIVPLIRVVALGLPMREWSDSLSLLAVALPIGVAALWLVPGTGLRLGRMFSLRRMSLADLYAGSAGAVLGLLAFLAGAPALYPDGAEGDRIAFAVGVAILAAAVEEVVFRGLLQGTLQRAFGRVGMLAAVALFTAMYLDAGSTALVLTIALAGVVFAHAVAHSGALAGVIVGHALLVTGAGAFWPALLDESAVPDLSEPATSIGIAFAIAIALALACWQPAVDADA